MPLASRVEPVAADRREGHLVEERQRRVHAVNLAERIAAVIPLARNAAQFAVSLLDHIVGADHQRRRDGQAKRLRGLEIDHEF